MEESTPTSPHPTPTRHRRADERAVAAVREALRRRRGRSKGTVNGLLPLNTQILQNRHGTDIVPEVITAKAKHRTPAPAKDEETAATAPVVNPMAALEKSDASARRHGMRRAAPHADDPTVGVTLTH
ncbi:hypothetical protein [Streptomyces sp. NBC_00572]|uniref:hypothetical protein n=1 Tax=Streptomyces sp. NBC_00572 TaxID=2903664 RepID=UPI002251FD0A|nr:hypothetical protein [Streptomyces sp. NBC_00572]MCX4985839.1 hypothetical protein [Streptomyces sp. NBC_00572]